MGILDEQLERLIDNIHESGCRVCGGEVRIEDAEDRNGDTVVAFKCLKPKRPDCEVIQKEWL